MYMRDSISDPLNDVYRIALVICIGDTLPGNFSQGGLRKNAARAMILSLD